MHVLFKVLILTVFFSCSIQQQQTLTIPETMQAHLVSEVHFEVLFNSIYSFDAHATFYSHSLLKIL